MDEASERAERARRALGEISTRYPDLTVGQLREMLSDPARREAAAPVVHLVAEALAPAAWEVGATLSGFLALVGEVVEIAARLRSQVTEAAGKLGQTAAWAHRLPGITREVFEPYRRQIETAGGGGIPPLPFPEQADLVMLALALQLPEEADRGALPPLEQAALVAERYDIVAAVLHARYPGLAERLKLVCADPQQNWEQRRQEAVADIYLVLGDTFSRRVWRAIERLAAPLAREKLDNALSEAYLFASLRNERLGRARRELWLEERKDDEAEVEEVPGGAETEDSRVARMTTTEAVETCLRESPTPALDAQIIEAISGDKSMEQLARETGVPASTLKYHRGRIAACLQRLRLEEPEG